MTQQILEAKAAIFDMIREAEMHAKAAQELGQRISQASQEVATMEAEAEKEEPKQE